MFNKIFVFNGYTGGYIICPLLTENGIYSIYNNRHVEYYYIDESDNIIYSS